MLTTTIPDFFLMITNTIAIITKTESRKNSTHPITASIIINDSLEADAVKLRSMNKSHHLLNQSTLRHTLWSG